MAFVLGVLGIDNQAGQQGIVLPPTTMDFKEQAPKARAVQAFRQAEMQLEGWEPLMPTLFLPAAPKSATTWLYGCMDNTFGSDQLCPVNKSASASEVWAECDKKFFMPAHVCTREGKCHPQKRPSGSKNRPLAMAISLARGFPSSSSPASPAWMTKRRSVR